VLEARHQLIHHRDVHRAFLTFAQRVRELQKLSPNPGCKEQFGNHGQLKKGNPRDTKSLKILKAEHGPHQRLRMRAVDDNQATDQI
jgi:hypothetical protein